MTKTALLVVYNHRYDKNIPRIDAMYRDRFSHVFHIIPFYDGNRPDVLRVYESSYRFQGYLSQAYTQLRNQGFTHFFVVADDMIINPRLNEHNYLDEIGLGTDDCYLDYLLHMQQLRRPWRTLEAMSYRLRQRYAEVEAVLPPRAEAEACFVRHGLPLGPIPAGPFLNIRPKFWLRYLLNWRHRRLDYPLVGGYCDLLVLPATAMERFCLYCGAFAATGLFVEIAIPTALALSAKRLRTNADTRLGGTALWDAAEKAALFARYGGRLDRLIEDFPENKLFLHPIKLSQWK